MKLADPITGTGAEDGNMRQHDIPQWLLRNIQDSSGKIYDLSFQDASNS